MIMLRVWCRTGREKRKKRKKMRVLSIRLVLASTLRRSLSYPTLHHTEI